MPEIISDKNLPKLLDTPVKQAEWAQKLVLEHLGRMFSRTLFVTFADSGVVAHLSLTLRHSLPSEELESAGAWAYSLSRKPSLGRVFSKGFLAGSSREAAETKLRPHLEAIWASPLEEVVAHYNLNEVNVLINKQYEVTGLIDWEMSTPLPFRVGFGRIHSIGKFQMPDKFKTAERGFWSKLFNGMPKHIPTSLDKRINLVVGRVTLKALPKLLTYRIPFIRGQE
ncbi:hypothetical protein F5B22DRAFT_656189 [Xylaria bambusicola]|uniref:uncharacterized protein n=1 Tax=Xylaria bambusicola TaxID=326684 RepID=UPI002007CCC8|nr:uncharacterized protein F5B22DRAFT_656189 [Xylaria bambusicola]KAI0515264.1 hypothetical protein F5B22DRAFT_656189 [Xylaria bambusicola]